MRLIDAASYAGRFEYEGYGTSGFDLSPWQAAERGRVHTKETVLRLFVTYV